MSFNLTITLQSRCYCPYFAEEKLEAQSSNLLNSYILNGGAGFEPRFDDPAPTFSHDAKYPSTITTGLCCYP